MSEDITDRGLVEIAASIHAGEVSSVECTRACLARIERLQPATNAFIRIDADEALAAAARADEAVARDDALGPLHGVPLAHKDLLYRAGRVSTGGSKILGERTASVTATAAERLDGAGAIDLGTLNMVEFAAGGTGHNEHHGDCRNPWDTERSTGGSSSGSGCAVAARMVFGALGSDTGGSVRMPAALCGVTGLKPTDGRVSRFGVMPRSWTSDTLGPMARSARDAARLLGVVAGHDPRDPATRQVPVPDYEAEVEERVDGLRVGIPNEGWIEHTVAEVQGVLEDVRCCLESLGCRTSGVDVPDPKPAFDLSEIIVKSESAAMHEQWLRERPEDYSIAIRAPIEAGTSRRRTTCMRSACEDPRSKNSTVRCSPMSTRCFCRRYRSPPRVWTTATPTPRPERPGRWRSFRVSPVQSATWACRRSCCRAGSPPIICPSGSSSSHRRSPNRSC